MNFEHLTRFLVVRSFDNDKLWFHKAARFTKI